MVNCLHGNVIGRGKMDWQLGTAVIRLGITSITLHFVQGTREIRLCSYIYIRVGPLPHPPGSAFS